MSIHITQFGKHKFICGLFWQSLSRPRELLKEAKELALKVDSDLMVLRKDHATAQAGFAHSRDGLRRNMYSLGAVVSKTMAMEGATYDGRKQAVHNWLGAFKLNDGKWAYFAVRDANFLPNGDFAGSKEEVLDRLHGDYGLGGWNVVIGDAELEKYGFHNFNTKKIEDLLPHKKNGQIRIHRWWSLTPVKSQITVPVIVLFLLLVAALAAAANYGWTQYQRKKQEQERDAAIAAARQKMFGGAAAASLPHPWKTQVLPAQLLTECQREFGHLTAGGWSLSEYECNGSGAKLSWIRQESNIDYLLAEIPGASIDPDGNRASLAVPIKFSSGQDDKLLGYKQVVEPLMSSLQLIGIVPRISKVIPPPPAPKTALGSSEPEPPRPDWDTYSFQFNAGSMPPYELIPQFNQAGIRINKLSYRGGDWTVEGNVYVKLP